MAHLRTIPVPVRPFGLCRALSLAALCLAAAAAPACRSSAIAAGAERGQAFGDAFRARVRLALASAGDDELHRRFTRLRTVRLSGHRPRSLDRLAVAGDGRFVVSDPVTPAVTVFDQHGRFVHHIGGKGAEPGRYQLPSGVATLGHDAVAVLDFDPKRLAVFDVGGRLLRSTAYSMHAFSGLALSAGPDGVLSAFGISALGGRRGPDSRLVHQFAADGTHLRSVLPLPADVPSSMWSFLDPSLAQSPRGLYVALSSRYAPFLVTPEGGVDSLALRPPATFRAPGSGFDPRTIVPSGPGTAPSEETKRRFSLAYQDWRLSWTPIETIAATGDLLLIEYQTFAPLRYTLDVWSVAGEPVLLEQLRTNLRLLAVSPDGTCVFRENVDGRDNVEPALVVAAPKVPSRHTS